MPFGGLTNVGPRNLVLDDGRDPRTGRDNFGACLAEWKALVTAALYAAKGIIQSSISAWQRHCYSRLQCSRLVGVTLHCRLGKSAPAAMRPFVKIVWPFVTFLRVCRVITAEWIQIMFFTLSYLKWYPIRFQVREKLGAKLDLSHWLHHSLLTLRFALPRILVVKSWTLYKAAEQEARLWQSDRATRYVHWNLVNCCTTPKNCTWNGLYWLCFKYFILVFY